MISIYPDYYKEFKCIAGACRHTCCAHWEIDIDEESLARYKRDGIPYISEEGDAPHFELKEDRCPFLNHENLCELILEHGEDYLCQICRDHPRFRNYFTDAEEIGLGLCCEAAAQLILGRKTPMKLIYVDEETSREISYEEFLITLPEDERYVYELRSERLKEAAKLADPMEARLTEYFLYRQIPDALYDGRLDERIEFVYDSVDKIVAGWESITGDDGKTGPESPKFAEMCEIARAYSDAIEYDDEILDARLDELAMM